ncbi:MAG TPA: Fic family protein [Ilumatobacteraceae bacterium]|nr:Fic family protein [Ilumatobacteraceae bacterium]HRB03693.1 Fic family protein [Ilumatobacteraceae bacterium]
MDERPRQSTDTPTISGQRASRRNTAASMPTAPTILDWPVAGRVPTTVTTESKSWRDGSVTHHLYALVPPFIADIPVALPDVLSSVVVAAERALAELDAQLDSCDAAVVEATTFALLRSESVSSSRIEGITVTHRRLAEAIQDAGSAKRLAREVVGNINAMQAAVAYGSGADPFTPDDILDLHRQLMAGAVGVKEGVYRTEQNWIGAEHSEDGVAYVPPPPGTIRGLMEDLCDFINTSPTTSVVRAAIAHAQFEAVHPFVDGNGRVGRCIVSITLRKAGGTTTIPPVSSVLLTNTDGYFAALHDFQQNANPGPWIEQFANATIVACSRAKALVIDIEELKTDWRQRTAARAGSHMTRLIDALPMLTLATADQVAQRLEIDANQARRLLGQLEDAGIAKQASDGRRNRVWCIDQMLRLLDDHSLART